MNRKILISKILLSAFSLVLLHIIAPHQSHCEEVVSVDTHEEHHHHEKEHKEHEGNLLDLFSHLSHCDEAEYSTSHIYNLHPIVVFTENNYVDTEEPTIKVISKTTYNYSFVVKATSFFTSFSHRGPPTRLV